MSRVPNNSKRPHAEPPTLKLSKRTTALMKILAAKPGAVAKPMSAPRAATPGVLIYKVMDKMFAILSIKGSEYVILKCDSQLVHVLRELYTGVGHRSHLDRRFWISVSLDADVPVTEVKRLVAHSYQLVCSSLTRKQQAALTAFSS